MNYEETIEKVHGFQKYGSRLGLERMTVLMNLLGNPQDRMKVIHVAGTNGKGSVCRYLTSVLQENGYKVGLYTSPYLERFTERIEFDGKEISEEDLIDCAAVVFRAVEQMLDSGYESPTEFELVTAIGFVYFGGKPIDILVLEVGLGGRGDSTNIIKAPLASVITSISHDHMNVLGDTLEEIAREKAGIIKAGCPVISNVQDSVAAAVIREIANEQGCYFYDSAQIEPQDVRKSLDGYSFTIKGSRDSGDGLFCDSGGSSVYDPGALLVDSGGPGFHDPGSPLLVELRMIGMHQIENAICALSVIEVLGKKGIIKFREKKVQSGMKRAYQKGRLEVLGRNPWLIIDGAHNEAGVKALTRAIEDHFSGKRILLVIGMLADKEVDRLVEYFCSIPADIAAAEPDNPRKLKAKQLCEAVNRAGKDCVALEDWEKTCSYIGREMHRYDVIIVSGSLYLIGKIRGQFANENEEGIVDL